MFERNRIDTVEFGLVSVLLTTVDGETLVGKVAVPVGRSVVDVLNGPASFVEFEPFEGERTYIAKSTIRTLRVVQVPKTGALTQKLRDLDGFDPWETLGVAKGAAWDEIRAAYHRVAKAYHPDRYATAELPTDVTAYLSNMARRINTAYATLEASNVQKKHFAALKQAPIYTSPVRV